MQGAVVHLFCFLSSGSERKRWWIPKWKLGKVSFVWLPWYLYLRVRLTALKWFEIVPGKHRKRDVTTATAYSHLNTSIDQWERPYCLKYFIYFLFLYKLIYLLRVTTRTKWTWEGWLWEYTYFVLYRVVLEDVDIKSLLQLTHLSEWKCWFEFEYMSYVIRNDMV